MRQRAAREKSKINGKADALESEFDNVVAKVKQEASKDWDYKVALGVIGLLSFATRFTGISHPNEVVFDEVHFGKVRKLYKMMYTGY